jgi:K+-transporting ATPase ATPase C chain
VENTQSKEGVLRPAVMMLGVMTLLTGLAYPLVVTGISQVVFHDKANGSLVKRDGIVVGSALIGQPFDDPKYFWGRPSATGPFPYNAGASSGSNLAVSNPAQLEAVKARVAKLRESGVPADQAIPADLVTASGSGLDPHISVRAADIQVARVAKSRRMNDATVRQLVEQHTHGRQLGLLGEPCVNVVELNLALDAATGRAEGNGSS